MSTAENDARPDCNWMTDTAENDAPRIARVDRYTITVGGHTIRADERQEQAIRSMTAQQRVDFLTIMGRTP